MGPLEKGRKNKGPREADREKGEGILRIFLETPRLERTDEGEIYELY